VIPELVEPAAQCAETLRIDVIHTTRALGLIDHETRLFQHLEVLRDGRAAHRHFRRDLPDRARPRAQMLEHLPPRRVGQGQQCAFVSHDLR